MELSLRWAERSKIAHADHPAALFGIVQGGMYEHLRDISLTGLKQIGFVPVGNTPQEHAAQIRKDMEIMGRAIKAAQIKAAG